MKKQFDTADIEFISLNNCVNCLEPSNDPIPGGGSNSGGVIGGGGSSEIEE